MSAEEKERASLLISYLNVLKDLLDQANEMSALHAELEESISQVTKEIEKVLIG